MNLINNQDELIYKKLLATRNVAHLTFDLYVYRKALSSLRDKARSDEFKKFLLSSIVQRRIKDCLRDAVKGHVDFAPTKDELDELMRDANGLLAKYDNARDEVNSLISEIFRFRNTFYDIGSLPIELGKLYGMSFDGIIGIYSAREEMDALIKEVFKYTPFRYGSDEWLYCLTKGQRWYYHYVFLGGHALKDVQDTLLNEYITAQVANNSNSNYTSDIVHNHLSRGANINLETYTMLLKGAYKKFHPRKDETAPTRYKVLASLSRAGFGNKDDIIVFINESFAEVKHYESWNLDLMLYNVFAACVYACPLEVWIDHFTRSLLVVPDFEVYAHKISLQAKFEFHESITSAFKESLERLKKEVDPGNSIKMIPLDSKK